MLLRVVFSQTGPALALVAADRAGMGGAEVPFAVPHGISLGRKLLVACSTPKIKLG